jgi:hypothetical protein
MMLLKESEHFQFQVREFSNPNTGDKSKQYVIHNKETGVDEVVDSQLWRIGPMFDQYEEACYPTTLDDGVGEPLIDLPATERAH